MFYRNFLENIWLFNLFEVVCKAWIITVNISAIKKKKHFENFAGIKFSRIRYFEKFHENKLSWKEPKNALN